MKRLTDHLFQWRDYLVLSVTVFVSVALLLLRNDNTMIGGLQGAVIQALSTLQKPIVRVKDVFTALEDNERLQNKIAELVISNNRLSEAFLENQRLRQMLDFELVEKYNCIPAKVIGRSGPASIRSILLNVGNRDGVKKYQPIVATSGLVGKVIDVTVDASVGQIIKDRNFRVGARVQRSRVEGIVKWAGNDRCVLSEVHKRADVKIGDVVLTSSSSALFQPGIKVGVVIGIDKNSSSMYQDVYLRPAVDFSKLEEVFVISSRDSHEQDQ